MRLRAVTTAGLAVMAMLLAIPAEGQAVDDVFYAYDDAGRLKTVSYTATGKTITYTYDKAGNRTSVVVFTNGSPNAVNDSADVCVFELIDISVLTNDTDPDSHPLTILSVTQPTLGSVSILPGNTVVRYHAGIFATIQTFNYTISDFNGGGDTATVTVEVFTSGPACP